MGWRAPLPLGERQGSMAGATPGDLPRLVSSKTRVRVPFCHVLEGHDPCDNIFWPMDQTIIALDTLDGLLEVSHGSLTWLAMQGVAATTLAWRPSP